MIRISVNRSFWRKYVSKIEPMTGQNYILDNAIFGRVGFGVYCVVEQTVQPTTTRIRLIKVSNTVDRNLVVTNPCYQQSWLGLKDSFLYKLALIEGNIVNRRYRGSVECPQCGRFLPAYLYKKQDWVWPAYYSHLIRDHGLRPSKKFFNYVMETF